jgi:hypothetical protein
VHHGNDAQSGTIVTTVSPVFEINARGIRRRLHRVFEIRGHGKKGIEERVRHVL